MTIININNVVWFSPNNGVHTDINILEYAPDEIYAMLKTAYTHWQDELLVEACCGGRGPFKKYNQLSLDEYLELKNKFELDIHTANATKEAKTLNTKIRRNEFNSKRAQTVLEMIDSGVPYICAIEGCINNTNLTIDHIKPLSRGGSDKLSNLQFMCHSHNSSKGDKV